MSISSKSSALNAQIRNTEKGMEKHQRKVDVCTAALINNIHAQISSPASLLMAAGIGFILGEITLRQTVLVTDNADNTLVVASSPLNRILRVISSVQTLHTALPLAWLIKSWYAPQSHSRKDRHNNFDVSAKTFSTRVKKTNPEIR